MQLQHLSIANFKNIAEASLDFSPKINCLLGNNGMGKSNLLDAIYYLSFCKSFSLMPDQMLIRQGEAFTTVRGNYLRRGAMEEVTLGMQTGHRKVLKRSGKEYVRLSQHIGTLPLVLAAPHDIDLIRGASEERRRWMDMVISQSNHQYLDALIRYNAALEQRNRLLRDGSADASLFEAIEMSMEMAAMVITRARSQWIADLVAEATKIHQQIASSAETVEITYRNSIEASGESSLCDALNRARIHDQAVRHTSVGPHRDDIDLSLSSMPLRRSGSQGQCKTFTLALKLAQYDFLHQATGLKPLLLLDDIFDRLDSQRVQRIMQLVASEGYGQIFITDTNRRHLDEIIAHTSSAEPSKMWSVDNGSFTLI